MGYSNPNRNTTIACRASLDFAKRIDVLSANLGSCRSEILRLSISEMLKNCEVSVQRDRLSLALALDL